MSSAAITLHGSLVQVYGVGILILGESGRGKSRLALKLISDGHSLVADDVVEISRDHDSLAGSAPKSLRGILEVRGIGLVNVRKLFGVYALTDNSSIDLCVCLDPVLPEDGERDTLEINGIEIPLSRSNQNLDLALFVEMLARLHRNPQAIVSMEKLHAAVTNI